MSETPQKILVRQWIRRAENDLLNVRNNLAAQEIPWDTICFHSQQAAEKYLKAVLVFYAQPVPRTHDLEHLLGMVVQWFPKSKNNGRRCAGCRRLLLPAVIQSRRLRLWMSLKADVRWILPKPFAEIVVLA